MRSRRGPERSLPPMDALPPEALPPEALRPLDRWQPYGDPREEERPDAEDPRAPRPPPSGLTYYAVGMAWNRDGNWSTRTGETIRDARRAALQACDTYNGDCADAGLVIGADGPICYALYRDGSALFAMTGADEEAAVEYALNACVQAGGTACALETSNCNDHP